MGLVIGYTFLALVVLAELPPVRMEEMPVLRAERERKATSRALPRLIQGAAMAVTLMLLPLPAIQGLVMAAAAPTAEARAQMAATALSS